MSCCANVCHPTGSLFLRFFKTSCMISTMLLPSSCAPSCINSPRSVHANSVLSHSAKYLSLTFMVFGTLYAISITTPFDAATCSATASDAAPSSFTTTTRVGCFFASVDHVVVALQYVIVQLLLFRHPGPIDRESRSSRRRAHALYYRPCPSAVDEGSPMAADPSRHFF